MTTLAEAVAVEVDVWPDEMAGWRCLTDRGGCGRYAGPYGTEVMARRNAEWPTSKCAPAGA